MPPGMGASPDKMLQARLLSYPDTHRYRIGINYGQLPVNKPHCPVNNYNRDGQLRFDGNHGGHVNYQPNSFNGPMDDKQFAEPPLTLSGKADRYDHRVDHDDYSQAGNLFRLMNTNKKTALIDNLVRALKPVPVIIQTRQLQHFHKADKAYGAGVAQGLGISI